jgi:mannose-6-phosphate isomerase-like protein (cupin superfamily)
MNDATDERQTRPKRDRWRKTNVFAVTNIAEERFGLDPGDYQLRQLRDPLGCEQVSISYLRFGPGWALSTGHAHPDQEEAFVLVSGRAEAKIGREIVELETWDALRVSPRTVFAIRAAGGEEAVFIAAGAPHTEVARTKFVRGFWPTVS